MSAEMVNRVAEAVIEFVAHELSDPRDIYDDIGGLKKAIDEEIGKPGEPVWNECRYTLHPDHPVEWGIKESRRERAALAAMTGMLAYEGNHAEGYEYVCAIEALRQGDAMLKALDAGAGEGGAQ